MEFQIENSLMHNDDLENHVNLLRHRVNDLEDLISKQKEYEQKFEFLHHVLDNVKEAIIATDLTGSITLWNGAAERIYGFKSEEVIGKNIEEVIQVEIHGLAYHELKLIVLAQGHWEGQVTHFSRDNKELKIDWSLSILKNNRGVDMGIAMINRDITEKKKVEKVLKETEQKFRRLVENVSTVSVQGFNDKREIIYWNKACENLYGYSNQEAFGRRLEELVIPHDNAAGFIEKLDAWINNENIMPAGEYILRRNNGQTVPVYSNFAKLQNVKGSYEYYQINIDLTEIKKAEESIKIERDKARQYFEIAGTILLVLNTEGRIVLINKKGCKVLGYDYDELIGSNWFDKCIVSNRMTEVKNVFQNVLSGNITSSERFMNLVRTRSGDTRTIAWHNTMLYDEDGVPSGVLSSGEDITEQQKAEEELLVAKEKAERSDKLKSEFLAQMSHEIRTPINSILSFSNLIEEEIGEEITEDIEMGFDIIKIGGKRLIRTIDLILNMSEIQAGTYDYVPKEINFYSEVVVHLFDEFKHQADSKGLELNLIKKTDEHYIYADEYTIIQVFNNLIDNAIKYTPEGKVEIVVERNEKDDYLVHIADTGIGISDDYLPQLFHAFSQEDQGYARKFEGNGLGLALVKKYCELNSALIKVKSKKNVGSIFTVVFPGRSLS